WRGAPADRRANMTERGGWQAALVGIALAFQADTAGAIEHATRAAELASASDDALEGPNVRFWAARALAHVGEFGRVAEAFLDLASAPAVDPKLAELLLSPAFDSFRQSQEFPAVLEALEAAEAEGARFDAEAGY
ncbi:MAG: hypothetical protein N2B05_08440, partial [Gemmatimonadales bacterium]